MDKFQLLQEIVADLSATTFPIGNITIEMIRQSKYTKAKLVPQIPGIIIGVRERGNRALISFSKTTHQQAWEFRRGVSFVELYNKIFDIVLDQFAERIGDVVSKADLSNIEREVRLWFLDVAKDHSLTIPCAIGRPNAPPFTIGPIAFATGNSFIQVGYGTIEKAREHWAASRLIDAMIQESAFWVAQVAIKRCELTRAHEKAELAVDLAIVGLQLIFHGDTAARMTRMTARSIPRIKVSVSASSDKHQITFANQEPGLGFGEGEFASGLARGADILGAVGRRIDWFISGVGSHSTFERAWCDAAYWFHEALAEPLDTIAIPKLETSIEVLFGAVNKKARDRICDAIRVFYGLADNDVIGPYSTKTVREFANDLVTDRSRILHGTWSTLSGDIVDSRADLTSLARELLAAYALQLDAYKAAGQTSERILDFLIWIERRRQ